MESRIITDVTELNKFLEEKKFYANGKNNRVDHLHETTAGSRWPLENIRGIYLAKPDFAWMAVWMAVVSRKRFRKRQICYFPPAAGGKPLGGIGIYDPVRVGLSGSLCGEAYLYFFDLEPLSGVRTIDPRKDKNIFDKEFRIIPSDGTGAGFFYKPVFAERSIVIVDEWQVALVNFGKIVPVLEMVLSEEFISELGKWVRSVPDEIGKDYIIK